MVIISESVHPRSLDFANQRKVIILRDPGYTCRAIASRVVNIQGEATTAQTVSRTRMGNGGRGWGCGRSGDEGGRWGGTEGGNRRRPPRGHITQTKVCYSSAASLCLVT